MNLGGVHGTGPILAKSWLAAAGVTGGLVPAVHGQIFQRGVNDKVSLVLAPDPSVCGCKVRRHLFSGLELLTSKKPSAHRQFLASSLAQSPQRQDSGFFSPGTELGSPSPSALPNEGNYFSFPPHQLDTRYNCLVNQGR